MSNKSPLYLDNEQVGSEVRYSESPKKSMKMNGNRSRNEIQFSMSQQYRNTINVQKLNDSGKNSPRMNESLPSIGNLSSFNPSKANIQTRSFNESPASSEQQNLPDVKRNRSFKSRLSKNGSASFKIRAKGSKTKDKDTSGKINKKNLVKETMKLLKIGLAQRFSKAKMKSARKRSSQEANLGVAEKVKPNSSVLVLNSKSKPIKTSPMKELKKVIMRFKSKWQILVLSRN